MDTQSILGNLNIVSVDVSCVSGAVSKTATDYQANDVFTDGSVRYLDRALLRPFTAARQAVARLCRTYGTRFLGGWAIPDESLAEVRSGIDAIIVDFEAAKQQFQADLPVHLAEWFTAHSEIGPYSQRFPTPNEIVTGIAIHAAAYKIDPQEIDGVSDPGHDGVEHALRGLPGQVLGEIAQEAKDAFSPGATKASAKARGILTRIARKLDTLAFVDRSLGNVGKLVQDVVDTLPATGPLHGRDFAIYTGLMNALMDPHSVVQTARIAAMEATDVWSALGAETPVSPAEPVNSVPDVVEATPVAKTAPVLLLPPPTPAFNVDNWAW